MANATNLHPSLLLVTLPSSLHFRPSESTLRGNAIWSTLAVTTARTCFGGKEAGGLPPRPGVLQLQVKCVLAECGLHALHANGLEDHHHGWVHEDQVFRWDTLMA
ncbi:hypothetical protein RHSIM_Rhsim06G0209700 [Rhododendron simsii]|uniref:Uncharacterized protein n=1 Tax=Rhododendron simsii TaxID=118357 RepID=A0A834LND4_RHOSS|nr:hypothetical protein RHSIM_Rhsim06G0209700 [Rhododendron simsii]